jgi:hypothetical protein
VTYSITEDLERKKYNQLLPSFAYPPVLLKEFSIQEITELFRYLGETFLSTKYTKTRDWLGFFNRNTDAEKIIHWLNEISNLNDSQFPEGRIPINDVSIMVDDDRPGNSQKVNLGWDEAQIEKVLDILILFCIKRFPEYFASLGLPSNEEDFSLSTPFEIAKSIYSKWTEEDVFLEEVLSQSKSHSPEWVQDLLQFCVQVILHKFNVVVKDKYKALFV